MIQSIIKPLSHTYASKLILSLIGSCVGGINCHAAGVEMKFDVGNFVENFSLKDESIQGKIEYIIQPAFFEKVYKEPLAPVFMRLTHSKPEKHTGTIMLSPLRVAEVQAYAALVRASKTHLTNYGLNSFRSNERGDAEEIKKKWSEKSREEKKSRMVVYYYNGDYQSGEKNVTWIPIGEVGLNRYSHSNGKKELFYWKGDSDYLSKHVQPAKFLKGIMSVATKGFMHFIFHEEQNLNSLLGYVSPGNERSSKLLENIGFKYLRQERENIDTWNVYAFERERFEKTYQIAWTKKGYRMKQVHSNGVLIVVAGCVLAGICMLALWVYHPSHTLQRSFVKKKRRARIERSEANRDEIADT